MKVPHNQTDIIIHNKNTKECIIIDVAIPVYQNIVKKEAEKITNYYDQEISINKY